MTVQHARIVYNTNEIQKKKNGKGQYSIFHFLLLIFICKELDLATLLSLEKTIHPYNNNSQTIQKEKIKQISQNKFDENHEIDMT